MAISHNSVRVLHRGVDVTGACTEAVWGSDPGMETYAAIRQETGEVEIVTDNLQFFIVSDPGLPWSIDGENIIMLCRTGD